MTLARPLRAAHPHLAPLLGGLFVLVGSLSIQLSAAVASDLFDTVGTLGVSGLRMAVAAVVLLVLVRPSVRGRSRRAWTRIVLYGVAMAAMNVLFYNAVAHLPLGIAVTLEFLGPLTVAAVATTRRRELLLPALTLVGVLLVSSPGGGLTLLGLVFGLGAAVAFGGYTVLAGRVGGDTDGLDGLALSVLVGAVLLSPFSVHAAPRVDGGGWGVLALSAVLGVVVAFSLDFLAVRITSVRVVGTLFAVDPVMGALVGAVALGQTLTAGVVLGIVLVVGSGAAVIWLAGRRAAELGADQTPPAAGVVPGVVPAVPPTSLPAPAQTVSPEPAPPSDASRS